MIERPRLLSALPSAVLVLIAVVLIAVVALFAAAPSPLAAQVPVPHPEARDTLRDDRAFSFHDRGPYRAAVPRPEDLLGYELGDWHTPYADQERVLLAIAAAAGDRVRVEEIGRTPERRMMRVFLVSSPDNMARLDDIRADLDRLADPRGADGAELRAIAERTPAVVMISGSVHGDEVPGYEAAMHLLYQLAASEEPATLALLENAVVVLNPSSNPDGHERFAVWYNSVAVGSPEPGALEQQRNQPWSIYGRFNRYRFDMNRDLFASTQREVQALTRTMLRWHPVLHADLHGYTAQFYFAPPASPVNAHLPEGTRRWFDVVGAGNAAAFDRYGWLYYVRDIFDLYYPGYYDSWPSLLGATGTTYETDGGPAFLKRRADGTLLSLRDGIAKHYVAALAAMETVAERRAERLADFLAFRQAGIEEGSAGSMRRVVFLDGDDPGRAAELAAMLLRNGLEVRRADAPFSSRRAHGYAAAAHADPGADANAGAGAGAGTGPASRSFEAGAYVVDLAQPLGLLARTLLEPSPEMDPDFAERQLERYRRNLDRGSDGVREGYEMYDVTAWSLPVAFGVEAFWTEDGAPVSGELLRLPAEVPAIGEALPVEVSGGVVRGARATSTYVFPNASQMASRLAAALMNEDFRVAISSEPMEVAGETWPRGTFVVRVSRNPDTLHDRIDALAREAGVEVVGLDTAFPLTGQFATGSESVVALEAPRVAVVGGSGISHTSFGAVWWTLEQRYRIPFTTLPVEALEGGDLSPYTVIVVPDANPGALGRIAGDGTSLRSWVSGGGTLVTMGGASTWAARENVNLTSSRVRSGDAEEETDAPAPPAEPATDPALGVRSPTATAEVPAPVSGSLFDAVLDRTHWLTLGVEAPRITALFGGSSFFLPSLTASNVAVFAPEGPLHRGGFIWPDTERLLRGTSLVIQEPLGSGNVILFANEPMFRGWWRSMDKLVLNAILLGSSF